MMFGGVPVKVKSPPVLAAKAKGINIFEAGVFKRQAEAMATGMSEATVPVLLMNPEIMAAPKIRRIKSVLELF